MVNISFHRVPYYISIGLGVLVGESPTLPLRLELHNLPISFELPQLRRSIFRSWTLNNFNMRHPFGNFSKLKPAVTSIELQRLRLLRKPLHFGVLCSTRKGQCSVYLSGTHYYIVCVCVCGSSHARLVTYGPPGVRTRRFPPKRLDTYGCTYLYIDICVADIHPPHCMHIFIY